VKIKKYSILLNDVEKDENISIENNYYGNYVCLNRKKLKNDIDYYREKILIIRKLNKIFTKKDPVILENDVEIHRISEIKWSTIVRINSRLLYLKKTRYIDEKRIIK